MQRSVGTLPPPDIPQHPPAQKVAGRRMSATRPRPHIVEPKVPAPSEDDDEPADYPRPPPPGTGEPHQHSQHEEEQPKREKKQPDHKPQQDLHKKAEQNRPKKDIPIAKSTVGGRISQPPSKVLSL